MTRILLIRWATLGLLAMAALSMPDATVLASMSRDCDACWAECGEFEEACAEAGGESNLCSASLDCHHCYVGDCYL